jgi:hypothetical protein
MHGLISSTDFVWNMFHSKKNRAIYDKKMYIGFHVQDPLFLSDFNETWQNFEKCASDFVKIHPVGAALFHADRQTDKTMLMVVFPTFANVPKKCQNLSNAHTFLNLLCPKTRWVQLLLS